MVATQQRTQDNGVLPEHEDHWPATDAVKALIRERYDGTYSTSHAIGQELSRPERAGYIYPSWRIEQIAGQIGLAEEKRDELIARVRAQEDGQKNDRARRQGTTGHEPQHHPPVHNIEQAIAVVSSGSQTPMKQMLREDLKVIANDPTCEQCGKRFEPYRMGRGVAKRFCRECNSQHIAENHHTRKNTMVEAPAVAEPQTAPDVPEPTPEPTPEHQFGRVDVLPEPRYLVHADGSHEMKNAAAAPDAPNNAASLRATSAPSPIDVSGIQIADDDLTFGDLPGSGIVFDLLDLLPTTGHWQLQRKHKWLAAMNAALDLLIEEDL